MTHHSGRDLYVEFRGVDLSGDFRALDTGESSGLYDTTAGADSDESHVEGVKSATMELVVLSNGTAGSAIRSALAVGNYGTIYWGPEGTAGNMPKYGCTVTVESLDYQFPYENEIEFTATLLKDGNWIKNYEHSGDVWASMVTQIQTIIDANGGVYWAMQEESGTTVDAYNTALATGRDIVINGDFASDTVWSKGSGWTISGGNATHTAGTASDLTQAGILGSGRSYEVTFTVSGRSAGSITPKCGTQAGTARSSNDTFTETVVANGTDLVFSATSDFDGSIDDVSTTQLNIAANDSNLDGSTTGATVGQTGPNETLAYLFDGLNDVVDVYSVDLNSFFNPDAGTLVVFAQVSGAGVWTDGSQQELVSIQGDGNNRIRIFKVANNTIRLLREDSGGNKLYDLTISTTDWFMLAMTWDVNAGASGEVKYYQDSGTALQTDTSVGTWAANLASNTAAIGATNNIPQNVWDGYIAHVQLYRTALTGAQILDLAQKGGVA
jgi:hypothetical protein